MNKIIIPSLILLLLILASCDRNKKDNFVNAYSLKKIGTADLPIDEETSTENNGIFYTEQENKTGVLYLLNSKKQIIQIYDWESKKLLKKIPLEEEGPNGVGTAINIYVENSNSIYVLASYNFMISKIDSLGKVHRKYSLLKTGVSQDKKTLGIPQNGYSVMVPGNPTNPIFGDKHRLISGAFPNLDFTTESYYDKGKSGIVVDLEADSISYVMNYPKWYGDQFKEGFRFPSQYLLSSLCFNPSENLAVINYPADENIYATNIKNFRTTKYAAPSKLFSNINLMSKASKDPLANFNHYIENHSYHGIFFDPYRKKYLRIVSHPNPKKHDEFDGLPWVFYSVMILDEKFRILGEEMIDIATNLIVFFREDGIYIWSLNKDSEDKIRFTRYEISKNSGL